MMTGRLLASGTIQEIHKLMTNVPKKIWIRTPHAPQIAVTLQSLEHIIGIDFHEDQGGIDVRTTASNDFYRNLPSILIEQKLRIIEMKSDDDSLDSVFEKLLNLHRGES